MIGKRLLAGSQRGPGPPPLLENDVKRTVVEIRRIQDIVIDRAEFDLGARLPDEIASVDIGMQRADEDADPPQRQARRNHPFAAFGHKRFGLVADLPPSISQSVSFCSSEIFMVPVFAAQLQRASSALATTAGVTRRRSCASFPAQKQKETSSVRHHHRRRRIGGLGHGPPALR